MNVAIASITLTPTSGAVGSTVSVSGRNFAPKSSVRFTFGTTYVLTLRANGHGSVSGSFQVPSVSNATYTVAATDSGGHTATAPFTTITAPTISDFWKGLDVGKWQGIGAEVKTAVGYVRLDTPTSAVVAAYASAGLGVIACIVGPYNTGGVSALNPDTWAANAVTLVQASPGIVALEVLNEPAGTWFWGSNAANATNALAYATLLKKVQAAFAVASITIPIIASFDGGYSGSTAWGTLLEQQDALVWTYVDGITMHPYGGTADRTASALGARASVTAANTATSLPVYVTEVGWPTAVGQPSTGDSFQWTETEQATNIHNFMAWARATGYVSAVVIFNYEDYGTNTWYGVVRKDGTHKPSFSALASA